MSGLALLLSRSCTLQRWALSLLQFVQEGSSGYVGADVSANALTAKSLPCALCKAIDVALCSACTRPCKVRLICHMI